MTSKREKSLGTQDSGLGTRRAWAVFLDRDGVINKETGYVATPENVELLDGSAAAVAKLNHAGALAIVITNQAVVARGLASEEDLAKVHARLRDLLAAEGAKLDGIFYCPHYPPPLSDPKADARYVIDCPCRKPKAGLLEEAAKRFAIDRARSFFVGDSTRDIAAARSFGCRAVLVRTGHGGRDEKFDVQPDAVVDDLSAAVDWILTERRNQ